MSLRLYSATFLNHRRTIADPDWRDERRACGRRATAPTYGIYALHRVPDETPHEHRAACARFLGFAASLRDARAMVTTERQAGVVPESAYVIAYVPVVAEELP